MDETTIFCNFEPEALIQSLLTWSRRLGLAIPGEIKRDLAGFSRTGPIWWLIGPELDGNNGGMLLSDQIKQHWAQGDLIFLLPSHDQSFLKEISDLGAKCLSVTNLPYSSRIEQPIDKALGELIGVPYRKSFWDSIALDLLRLSYSRSAPPCKVIAVDADYTLWDGACAEGQVQIGTQSQYLHEYLRARKEEGKLLCLISKNDPADVQGALASLDSLDSRHLKPEDFAQISCGWNRKSDYLIEISERFGLALESFAFLDDNPSECQEVELRLPQVTVVRIPDKDRQSLLDDTWFLSAREYEVHKVDRTSWYSSRAVAGPGQHEAVNLEIDILPLVQLTPSQIDRVADLSFRTTQFNFSGKRWLPEEIQRRINAGSTLDFGVIARDQYTDYGLVGAVFLNHSHPLLTIENFVLSCRILMKGVEGRVFRHLAQLSSEIGAAKINFEFGETKRNLPAQAWLTLLGKEGDAGRFSNVPDSIAFAQAEKDVVASTEATAINNWQLASAAIQEIDWVGSSEVAQPGEQRQIAQIVAQCWKSILGETPSPESSFFASGADSLAVARFVALLRTYSSISVPMWLPYKHSTLAEMCTALDDLPSMQMAASKSIPEVDYHQNSRNFSNDKHQLIIVPSRDRPERAAQLVSSLPATLGEKTPYLSVLVQYSNQQAEADYVRTLGSAAITQLDLKDLIKYLCQAGCPERVLDFLLLKQGPVRVGANRNHGLLLGSGLTALHMDDDTSWKFYRTCVDEPGPGAHADNCSFWSWNAVPEMEQVQDPFSELRAALHPETEPVSVAFLGVLGDCGWQSSFGIPHNLIGFLALTGESLRRFAEDGARYSQSMTDRRILRVASKACRADFGITVAAAIRDEGEPGQIPPFLPAHIGEDLVWSVALNICGVPMFHAPLAIEHKPPPRHSFSRNSFLSGARIISYARYMTAALSASVAGIDRSLSTLELGDAIRHLTSKTDREFQDSVMEVILERNRLARDWLKNQIDTYPDLCEEWKSDVVAFCSELSAAEKSKDYRVPLIGEELHAHDATAFMKNLLSDYGEALQYWPIACKAAREMCSDLLSSKWRESSGSRLQVQEEGANNDLWLQRGDGGKTLVMLPNVWEDVMLYRTLAEDLSGLDPSLSIQILNPHRRQENPSTRDALISEYLKHLPNEGSLVLFGYCAAGSWLVEMASALEANGTPPLAIVLVESLPEFELSTFAQTLTNTWRSAVKFGFPDGLSYVGTKLRRHDKLKWIHDFIKKRSDKHSYAGKPSAAPVLPKIKTQIRSHQAIELPPQFRCIDGRYFGWGAFSRSVAAFWHRVYWHGVLPSQVARKFIAKDICDLFARETTIHAHEDTIHSAKNAWLEGRTLEV